VTNSVAYIYSLRADGTDFAVLRTFAPGEATRLGQLIEGSDGNFYVTAGTRVLRVSRTGDVVSIHDGDRAAPNSLMEGSDGALYGYNSWGYEFFRLNKDGSDYASVPFSNARNEYGKRIVEETEGAFLVIDDNILNSVRISDSYPTYLRGFPLYQNDWGIEPTFGLVKSSNNIIYGLTAGGGSLGLGTVFRLGPAPTASNLEVVSATSNATVKVSGSLGTRYQVESAGSPEGPWTDLPMGIGFEPDGVSISSPTATNVFFRTRLLDY
jgi:hypothetical protein